MNTDNRDKRRQFYPGKYFFVFTASFLLFAAHSFSQSITWQRLYNTPGINQSVSKASCMADNGNIYTGGTVFISNNWDIYVMKLNPYGDTIWTRTLDTLATEVFAMASTIDGGCVIVGDNHYSIKFDLNGNIVWAKYYGDGRIWLYDIIKTIDGGYIACGELFDAGTFTSNGYLMKLDLNGNTVWQQIYPTNDLKILNSIVELANGGFVLTGTDSDFFGDTVKIFLLKVNSLGEVIMDKEYSILGKGSNGFSINIINEQFLIGGSTSDSTGTYTNTCFLRVDTSGNLLYSKRYNANRNEGFYDMKVISYNKFIFTRYRSNPGDSYVMIIDTLGISYNEQSFSLPSYALFRSILLMPNGDFLFSGEGKLSLQTEYRTFIVRADSNLYAPPIGITNISYNTPDIFVLKQNYPNPFNSNTIIEFSVKKPANIEIKLFDVTGKHLKTLVNSFYLQGTYSTHFSAVNFASGIYFYQILVDGLPLATKKMLLLK